MIDFLLTLFPPTDPLLLWCLLLVISYAYDPSSYTPPSFISIYFESLVVDFWDFAFVHTYTPYVRVGFCPCTCTFPVSCSHTPALFPPPLFFSTSLVYLVWSDFLFICLVAVFL